VGDRGGKGWWVRNWGGGGRGVEGRGMGWIKLGKEDLVEGWGEGEGGVEENVVDC